MVLIVVALPAASFGAYRLFLYLYLPPAKGATSPIVVSTTCRASSDPDVAMDDACRACSTAELKTIRLCVQSDDAAFIGHAFVRTDDFSVGFRTNERDIGLIDYLWPWAQHHPGYIQSDDTSPFDFELIYRACPATIEALRESIFSHAQSNYQVGNWRGGHNCATWATDRLRDAGLMAPPGDCPNRMAWWMLSADGTVILKTQDEPQVVMEIKS